MILKNVDDKSEIIKNLEKLLKNPKIYSSKKKQIKYEIYKIKKGWQNEKEAAYYINTYYDTPEKEKKVIVLHDLRIKYQDISFQIDHLLIFRSGIVIFESKYFSSYLHYDKVNKSFSIKTTKGMMGIQNPLKQAERQALNLKKLIHKSNILKINLPDRIDSYVLVSPKVYFRGKMPDRILRADQFMDKFAEENDNISILEGIKVIKNYLTHSFDDIKKASQFLLELHQPLTYDDYLKMLKLDWITKKF